MRTSGESVVVSASDYARMKAADDLLVERVKVNLIKDNVAMVTAAVEWRLKLSVFCRNHRVFIRV